MTESLENSQPPPTGPLILLVDDDADTRDLLALFFVDSGFNVEQANNGADALTKFRSGLPDIVLSDLSMPVMDGFALCRAIKRDERTAHVPVVAVSSNTCVQNVTAAEAAGFDKVLPKPSDLDHLLAEIRNTLVTTARLRESGRILRAESERLRRDTGQLCTKTAQILGWLFEDADRRRRRR